jgi:NAD(P)-dependent dehydrogenase (short-subunit alcohol dehydrogenase family)
MGEGKVGVVTGASGGIGLEIARAIAAEGWTALLVARSEAKVRAAAEDIRASTKGGRVEVVVADLGRMDDVRRAAGEIAARHQRIDGLVHNAAVVPKTRNVTADGLEEAFATNVLAPFVLSERLRPSLERAKGRAVFFFGGGQPNFDIDDLQSTKKFDGWNAYCQTKNACVMLARESAKRFAPSGVTYVAAIPGLVNTAGMRGLPGRMQIFSILFRPFMRTPAEGARTAVWLATSPELPEGAAGEVFGSMMGDWKQVMTRLPPAVRDDGLCRRLWEECERLAGRTAQSAARAAS